MLSIEYNLVTLGLVLLFLCLLLSAFFSSSETAFISLQKLRLRQMADKGNTRAKQVATLMERPEQFLSTVLVGNNLVNTAAAALGTLIAALFFGPEVGAVVATGVVTALVVVFGEVIPKTLATHHAETLALAYVRPIQALSRLFGPVVAALAALLSLFTSLIGSSSSSKSLVSEEEIRYIITMGREQGIVEKSEAEMLQRVFRFGDRRVREAMIPRPDVVAVEKGTSIKDFLNFYVESPFSRYPVYEENLDNILGILSIQQVVTAQINGKISPETKVEALLSPAYFVPETKPIGQLFTEMQSRGHQIAIVVDEFGGTAGIVTQELLAAEIVGPLGEVLGGAEKEYQTIDEKTVEVDAEMHIEEANEALGLDLPPGKYHTVAGFLLDALGHIPKEGEQLVRGSQRLVVAKMKGLKIDKVLIRRS